MDEEEKVSDKHSEEAEAEESSEEEAPDNSKIKQFVPRPWESSSREESEIEVKKLTVKPTRPLLKLSIGKKRRYFGQLMSKLSGTESAQPLEIYHTRDPNFKKENFKKTVEVGLQAGCGITLLPQPKGQGFQNKYFVNAHKSTIYSEKDFLDSYKEDLNKIQDVTEVPAIEHFIRNVETKVEEALQSNETIDVFHDEFEMLGEEGTEGSGNLGGIMNKTRTFSDLDYTKGKLVSDIRWKPGETDIVAATCVENFDYDKRIKESGVNIPGGIIVWSFAEFRNIIIVLKSPFEVTCFSFNPHNPSIVIGGTISGQVCFWDTSLVNDKNKIDMLPKQKEAHELLTLTNSGINDSHKGPVKSICWLPGKVRVERKNYFVLLEEEKGVTQVSTLSEDGLILFWETHFTTDKSPYKNSEFIWQPLLRVQMTRPDNRNEMGGSFHYLSLKQDHSLIWATNDHGDLVQVDWAARSMDDSKPESVKKMYSCDVNFRPATALDVSPFFSDIILTVHDFHFSIWKNGCETPVYTSYFHSTYLTCGSFSPTRPAVIFIGRSDGRIDIWDFLDQSHKESLFFNLTSQKLTLIRFLEVKRTPQLVAVGDYLGNVHVLEVARQTPKDLEREKKTIYGFWSSEEERVKYFEERFEIRAEEFQQAEMERRLQQAKAQ